MFLCSFFYIYKAQLYLKEWKGIHGDYDVLSWTRDFWVKNLGSGIL